MKHPIHALALAATLLVGCVSNPISNASSTYDLSQLQSAYAAGDYLRVAKLEVDCAPSADGCAKAHLIKGHAHLKLAFVQGGDCQLADGEQLAKARAELSSATQQIQQWSGVVDLHESASYEGLMQSVRCLGEQSKGERAAAFADELAGVAEGYLKRHPGDVMATWYHVSAQVKQSRAGLFGADPSSACLAIAAARAQLNAAEPTAGDYVGAYNRLDGDIQLLLSNPACASR